MKKTLLLILHIYILFSSEGFCQNLKLKINGYTDEETQIIDSLNYSRNHKNYLSIKSEVDTIQKLLYRKGFIENRTEGIKQINDSLYSANFQLKKRFDLIHIYYDKDLIDNSILKTLSNRIQDDYFELNFIDLENKLHYLNEKIGENGQPFSKIRLSEIKLKDDNTLSAKLVASIPNQQRAINEIIIKGYEKFPESYLKHYLKIKPSQIFNLSRVKKQTKQLQNLRFASEAKAPEVLFSKDSTSVYLYLKKEQTNSFDGFLGFGTNEETNKIEFDGYLNLILNNNLNYGESLRLFYKSDENDQQTFLTNITLPYLFKSPIGLDLELNIFRKDSTFTTAKQSAKLHYQINPEHKIYSGILLEESNNLLNQNTSPLISDYKKNYIQFGYEFTKAQTNNLLFPINASLYLEANLGNRKEEDREEKQSLLSFNAFKIFNLNQKNSIYLRTNGARIASDSFFENELLRFGGINSIRGFEENSLFASLYGLINTEYRFQLNNSIYLHSVIDAAYFENKPINLKEKLFAYGFGFGILTKSGLFKLNYANGKRENQQFKLSNSKVHISLTTIF